MRAEYIGANKEGEREALHEEQRVVYCDTGDFNGRVDIAAYLSAGAYNADDIRRCASEWLNNGSVAVSRKEHCSALKRLSQRL